jgi:hypothetical protein
MFTRLARSNSSDSKSLNNLNTIDESLLLLPTLFEVSFDIAFKYFFDSFK